ncbi:hypothetical protein M6B38_252050 [Iris pallida]|uniref:Uncharacterized protein n=1 Tax=Iris pallida TaxID=29817 RepID=A0AAX6E103_IRIPA|nr:hypothetical protein M6B38_218090 [Iris pallida]KAJ6853007.1 hypothetical protein M6B38_252050 [Iris pallida]
MARELLPGGGSSSSSMTVVQCLLHGARCRSTTFSFEASSASSLAAHRPSFRREADRLLLLRLTQHRRTLIFSAGLPSISSPTEVSSFWFLKNLFVSLISIRSPIDLFTDLYRNVQSRSVSFYQCMYDIF